MGRQTCKLVAVAAVAALLIAAVDRPSYGAEHKVGDETGWRIPPYDDLYGDWSSSRTFRAGDTLLFEFDPGFYDVMQVSRTEYDDCTADKPFVAFSGEAPVAVPLMESGVFYYVCSVLNYCSLGQKLNVSVQPASPLPSSPVPLPANS